MLPKGNMFTLLDQLEDYEKTLKIMPLSDFDAHARKAHKHSDLWKVYIKVAEQRR